MEFVIGAFAALVAVAFRYVLPLDPQLLPTVGVVVALAIVTAMVGLTAGVVVAVLGGTLSWYLFLNPSSWSLANQAWIHLLGYAVVAVVILATSYLYRRSERRQHDRDLARLRSEADASRLFARELAHRLGNTLAIVQTIAAQTIGKETPESVAFTGRLKALSKANDLLTYHVDKPTAPIAQVIEAALRPFDGGGQMFEIATVPATIDAQQVISLSLSLHELATNAVKHGSLSVPGGVVSVTVEQDPNHLAVHWRERGGPQVAPPGRQGFGTRLLRRSQLKFDRDGVSCTLQIPNAVVRN